MDESRPIRVVAVDDSALMRAMLRGALEQDGDIAVLGLAANTAEGREMIRSLDPDVVTLDVEMPGMSGIAFLEKIMTLRPTPVVMVSSLTRRGTETALEALEIGAVDAIPKPDGPEAARAWGALLRQVVRGAAGARVQRRAAAIPPRPAPQSAVRSAPHPAIRPVGRRLVAIGASTGGVGAIGQLFQGLPPGLVPIVIAQHMPPGYTERFARRLAAETGQDVAEARDGEPLAPGMVRIAPGDRHLTVERAGTGLRTRLGGTELVSGHCPSVDRLFHSVAEAAAAAALGVILTGMGRDGADGLLAMRRIGAPCLGQSAESCVVYGMPKAAMAAGAVAEELPLGPLAARIARHARAAGGGAG
jgi:two-component system, chemotaxis family, protein-glutamate methylesterase/glutaminase